MAAFLAPLALLAQEKKGPYESDFESAWFACRGLQDDRRREVEDLYLRAERTQGRCQAAGDRILFWWKLAGWHTKAVPGALPLSGLEGDGGYDDRLSCFQSTGHQASSTACVMANPPCAGFAKTPGPTRHRPGSCRGRRRLGRGPCCRLHRHIAEARRTGRGRQRQLGAQCACAL